MPIILNRILNAHSAIIIIVHGGHFLLGVAINLKFYCTFKFLISAGCKEFINSTLFDKKNSTFSQAPGTVVVLSCSLNKEREVILICQDDGQWEPNLDDLLCTAGIISLFYDIA